ELTGREHLDRQRLTSLIALELLGLLEPNLTDDAHRRHVRLLEVPRFGLRHVLLLRPEADLKRVVAVRLRRADLDDRARPSLDDRHRHMAAILRKHLRHPHLPPDQPFLTRHRYPASPAARDRLLELLHFAADQKCPDARRRGGPTEAYASYAAGRAARANEADGRFSSAATA